MQQLASSRDTVTRDATTEPRHLLSTTVTTHTPQPPMGFPVGPSPTDNVCNVPHRRTINSNGIISRMNRLTDIRHATIGATILQLYRQLCPLSPPARVKGLVPLRHTRKGLRRFMRELSCSVDSTAHTKRSIALVELRHDK